MSCMGKFQHLICLIMAQSGIAVATLLAFGVASCAAERGSIASTSDAEAISYVGVFTGEFVDGKPLYRFPAIHVVGSRNSIAPEM